MLGEQLIGVISERVKGVQVMSLYVFTAFSFAFPLTKAESCLALCPVSAGLPMLPLMSVSSDRTDSV